MKKLFYLIFTFLLTGILCLSFLGCNGGNPSENSELFDEGDPSGTPIEIPSPSFSAGEEAETPILPAPSQGDEPLSEDPIISADIVTEEPPPPEEITTTNRSGVQDEDPTMGDSPPEEDPLFLSTEEPSIEKEEYTAACAKCTVNVRKGPSTSYASLALLRAGDSLPFLWREGKWLAVRWGDRVGYIHGDYAYLTETSSLLEEVISAGLDKIGTPYEWGATRLITDQGNVNPYFTGKSFDCSSFVQYCYYIGAGIKLGNYTGSQADHTVGEIISSYADLKRGDFFFTGNGSISHVVIYLGGGYLLQTYSANGGPVSVTAEDRWKSKFLSGRRPDLSVIEQFR